ncbi:MAG: hypothetical protein PHV36_05210 [Elusimicrobiales bacterium]|nr:hypothetical protein [Elusimicrobiales bacterium]
MKFSAAILVIAISAAPAAAANWAPAVNSDALAAIETPAAAPSRANPRDGQNYSGAEELLIKEFAITAINLDIPEAEVMQQNGFANAFCFEHALRQALNAVLEDYSNSTSPLAKALGEIGALTKPTKSDLKKARQKTMDRLNNPAALIAIVRPYKHNQPQAGETVEKNWIFYLRMEGASYWAVVDRSGEKAPYVYGMN